MNKRLQANKRDVNLGPLPVALINRVLGYELEAGDLVLKFAAQIHAEKRHPEEFSVMFPALAEVLASALYVGDDHNNPNKIELIGKIQNRDQFILIAVTIEVDNDGSYKVVSFYPVSQNKIQNRREKGFLKLLI